MRQALLAIGLFTAACGSQLDDTCDRVEESVQQCGGAYYGDENCEALYEDCDDDDLVALDAFWQCVAHDCDGNGECGFLLDRLSGACFYGATGN